MNALILDDEKKARDVLQVQLEFHVPEISAIRQAGSADEASALLEQFEPEVVFLDIKMPGKDGFSWLKSLDRYNFQVIFTTAYDQYAIQAIRFAAFDYLLKPVDAEELRNSMDRLLQNTAGQQQTFENLLYNTAQQDPKNYRLTIATTSGTHFIDPGQIARCEADGNYTYFFLLDGKRIVASRPIGYFIELLEDYGFVRCHKSHLVNAAAIVKLGEDGLTLTDGSQVDVARRRRQEVKNVLAKYALITPES